MSLTISKPVGDKAQDAAEVNLSNELYSKNASLFVMPDDDKIIVNLNEEYTFVVADYVTSGLGTIFDKVELLQLSEFSQFDERTRSVLIKPVDRD